MPASRDFLEFHELPAETVTTILARAGVLATAWVERRMPQSLQGKRVGLIVDDGGWRNTAAFDLGVQAMGGICVQLPISFNTREVTEDLASYLDNWFDLLVVRTKLLSTLQQLAASAEAPVINARTQSNHPCETLGDLAYVHSKRGSIDGLKVVGAAPDANILRSWVEASIRLPITVVQVYPEQWHVNEPRLLNPNFSVSTDPQEIADADVIITDCWPTDADQAELAGFQVSSALLDRLRPDAMFLPCPPVTRGQEVTGDAMTHPLCQSRAAKAFLLHGQNALLECIASGLR